MGLSALLVMAAVLVDAPAVKVTTLDGVQAQGNLQFLTETELVLRKDDAEEHIPVEKLLDLSIVQSSQEKETAEAIELRLVDGSIFPCSQLTSDQKTVNVQSTRLGKLSAKLEHVRAVRFAPATTDAIRDSWQELCARELKRDLLVIRKEDSLDYLDGAVGAIDETHVRFLLDKDLIPVQREKVFGVIFQRENATVAQPRCRLELAGGFPLNAKSITWAGDKFRVTLTTESVVEIAPSQLLTADFSFGKLRYLSQMEPRDVEYTPFFDITWEYRKDRNLDGQPIRLGDVTYSRGLCIHSKTLLRYRIGGDYRRFQAVMGIDESVAQNGYGHVHVVIRGDTKTLLESDVTWKDEPRPLDLDVTGVRDLEILVDFGKDLDISDHLDLADAKVTK